jgi:hypothetical protein
MMIDGVSRVRGMWPLNLLQVDQHKGALAHIALRELATGHQRFMGLNAAPSSPLDAHTVVNAASGEGS